MTDDFHLNNSDSAFSAASLTESAQAELERGQQAFSGGQYRAAIAALESAAAQAPPQTRLSGDIQMLLVSSYEGAGDRQQAQTLCRALTKHSDLEIRDQAKGLLYVLEAPVLKSKPEWLVEIPDLTETEEDDRYRWGGGSSTIKEPEPEPWIPEPADPTQVNLRDNRFIWVALALVGLIAVGLFRAY